MTPLYLCNASNINAAALAASSTTTTADASTSSMSSAHASDNTTRRPSNVIMHPPKPKKKKTHSTDPYLRDFTLVAEAARRAQMSLMTRDMEDPRAIPFLGLFPSQATNERNAMHDSTGVKYLVPNEFDALHMRGSYSTTCQGTGDRALSPSPG